MNKTATKFNFWCWIYDWLEKQLEKNKTKENAQNLYDGYRWIKEGLFLV
jgi:hypothetical protein